MTDSKHNFRTIFKNFLAFNPTEKQANAIDLFSSFLYSNDKENLIILSGYAGTGKTSLIGSLVKSQFSLKKKCVLLAPTGRAAKVFSTFAGQKAFTIHKKIYRKQKIEGGITQLTLAPNLSKNTLFIVDEASMIADYSINSSGGINERNLLEDLFSFVYGNENCKLILVGDEGQLPPVGSNFSPALNIEYLNHHFPQLKLKGIQLDEVVRQSKESDILKHATKIRSLKENLPLKLKLNPKSDCQQINGLEFQEKLENAYNFSGPEETIVITKSNKRANAYNQEIRKRVLFYEEEITSGDIMMVVKNNYHWVPETSDVGFIANGEIIKIKRLFRQEDLYGFRFQHAEIILVDYPDLEPIKTILLLDTINSETPSLSREDLKKLFFEIEQDYADERNKKIRYEKILANPYFNALQVKFAYAITCHKAQGGQWEQVFLDHGYLGEILDESFYRWLYTGFTRAKEKLFLVNFDEQFIKS